MKYYVIATKTITILMEGVRKLTCIEHLLYTSSLHESSRIF